MVCAVKLPGSQAAPTDGGSRAAAVARRGVPHFTKKSRLAKDMVSVSGEITDQGPEVRDHFRDQEQSPD